MAAAAIKPALSVLEREAIETIRSLRRVALSTPEDGPALDNVGIVHDILESYHGHLGLRLAMLAEGLGTAMRVLERQFRSRYGMTMAEFSEKVRMEFAQLILRQNPDFKIAALANLLGYKRSTDFTHFFHSHSKDNLTPSAFKKRARAQHARKDRNPTSRSDD
jgi:transcriptional regulator GlxA family with amidase domain